MKTTTLFVSIFFAVFLTGCADRQERAFLECRFELTKVLASRSANSEIQLDRMLKRAFVSDCMLSKGQKVMSSQLEML
jgi:hypothetical protein